MNFKYANRCENCIHENFRLTKNSMLCWYGGMKRIKKNGITQFEIRKVYKNSICSYYIRSNKI